ncbi:MAG: hypothetical protein AAFU85_30745 [Planctomycetota bacterium]
MSGHATERACELWSGDGLCDAVACSVLATISDVRESLVAQQFVGRQERQFVRLATWMEKIDVAHQRRALNAPSAFHWSVIASDLMASLFRAHSPSPIARRYMESFQASSVREAWESHLGQFGRYAISVAHFAGESLTLDGIDLRLPQALPATPYSFSSEQGCVRLIGIKDGRSVQFLVDGQPCSVDLSKRMGPVYQAKGGRLTVHRAAELTAGGQRPVLQPHEFSHTDLDEFRDVSASTPESQCGLIDEVESALACLQSYVPRDFSRLVRSMRALALKPPESGGALAVADPLLPGAALLTEGRHPLVLAEDFLRVDAASRFVLLRESVCLLERPDRAFGYSPWRDRPCGAIERLADALVFERVLAFWIAVLERQETVGIELEYATFRVAKLCRQLSIAIASLRSVDVWSESAAALVRQLRDNVSSHQRDAESRGIGGDVDVVITAPEGFFKHLVDRDGASIRVDEMIDEHLRRYSIIDNANQPA